MVPIFLCLVYVTVVPMMPAVMARDSNHQRRQALLGSPVAHAIEDKSGHLIESDLSPKISKKCETRGFCLENEVENYPERLAEKLIIENNVRKMIEKPDKGPNITMRQIPICETERMMFYPKALQGPKRRYQFVLNSENAPVQGFYVELCKRNEITNQPLSYNSAAVDLPDDYKLSDCTQKYVYKELYVIKGGKYVVQKKLKVPSCCTPSIIRA